MDSKTKYAFEENLFCLYAQVIVPLDGSADIYYELLIRMFSEDKKIILPEKISQKIMLGSLSQ